MTTQSRHRPPLPNPVLSQQRGLVMKSTACQHKRKRALALAGELYSLQPRGLRYKQPVLPLVGLGSTHSYYDSVIYKAMVIIPTEMMSL